MRPMRSALLWMARNERLQQTIPTLPFAQRAVRRFMPGERVEDAFAAAERLRDERIGVLFTRLGENISSLEEAEEVAAHYRSVLGQDAARAHTTGPIEISIKPTQLGLDQDVDACLAHCHDIAERCAAQGTWFWIDMEGSDYTDATLDLAETLLASHDNVGIALQSYLRRTAADVQRLLPLRPAIRLVKGAYDEPAAIAYRSAAEVDANFLALARDHRRPCSARRSQAGPGHPRRRAHRADPDHHRCPGHPGRQRSRCTCSTASGSASLPRLRDAGHPAFSLVAYGSAWYRWYMRRLAERPANVALRPAAAAALTRLVRRGPPSADLHATVRGMHLATEWLGRMPYREAWQRQRSLVDARAADAAPDTLLLVEHDPVLTLGRHATDDHVIASPAELRRRGIEVIRVERGGEVTYHGPGQLVAYPIVRLRDRGHPAAALRAGTRIGHG